MRFNRAVAAAVMSRAAVAAKGGWSRILGTVSAEYSPAAYAAGSFPQRLLTSLLDDPEALAIAHETLEEVRS